MTEPQLSITHLQVLQTRAGYTAHFMEVELWTPVIQAICTGVGLECRQIRAGTAGTFPVFLLDDRYVIKFFGPLFEGRRSARVEMAVDASLAAQPGLAVARILFSGQVPGTESEWQYLIYNLIRGNSYRDDRSRISQENQLNIARQLGQMMRRFHSLPVPQEPADVFPVECSAYQARLHGWFSSRLQAVDGPLYARLGLPAHLATQAEGYLARNAQPPADDPLHLIHADLTADHLLGEFEGGEWHINGLIDMGDCMTGDLYYELAALFLDLFSADKSLLSVFLNSYGFPEDLLPAFPQRCLCAALQHQFNVFSPLFENQPALAQAPNLDHLAQWVWGLSSPFSASHT